MRPRGPGRADLWSVEHRRVFVLHVKSLQGFEQSRACSAHNRKALLALRMCQAAVGTIPCRDSEGGFPECSWKGHTCCALSLWLYFEGQLLRKRHHACMISSPATQAWFLRERRGGGGGAHCNGLRRHSAHPHLSSSIFCYMIWVKSIYCFEIQFSHLQDPTLFFPISSCTHKANPTF